MPSDPHPPSPRRSGPDGSTHGDSNFDDVFGSDDDLSADDLPPPRRSTNPNRKPLDKLVQTQDEDWLQKMALDSQEGILPGLVDSVEGFHPGMLDSHDEFPRGKPARGTPPRPLDSGSDQGKVPPRARESTRAQGRSPFAFHHFDESEQDGFALPDRPSAGHPSPTFDDSEEDFGALPLDPPSTVRRAPGLPDAPSDPDLFASDEVDALPPLIEPTARPAPSFDALDSQDDADDAVDADSLWTPSARRPASDPFEDSGAAFAMPLDSRDGDSRDGDSEDGWEPLQARILDESDDGPSPFEDSRDDASPLGDSPFGDSPFGDSGDFSMPLGSAEDRPSFQARILDEIDEDDDEMNWIPPTLRKLANQSQSQDAMSVPLESGDFQSPMFEDEPASASEEAPPLDPGLLWSTSAPGWGEAPPAPKPKPAAPDPLSVPLTEDDLGTLPSGEVPIPDLSTPPEPAAELPAAPPSFPEPSSAGSGRAQLGGVPIDEEFGADLFGLPPAVGSGEPLSPLRPDEVPTHGAPPRPAPLESPFGSTSAADRASPLDPLEAARAPVFDASGEDEGGTDVEMPVSFGALQESGDGFAPLPLSSSSDLGHASDWLMESDEALPLEESGVLPIHSEGWLDDMSGSMPGEVSGWQTASWIQRSRDSRRVDAWNVSQRLGPASGPLPSVTPGDRLGRPPTPQIDDPLSGGPNPGWGGAASPLFESQSSIGEPLPGFGRAQPSSELGGIPSSLSASGMFTSAADLFASASELGSVSSGFGSVSGEGKRLFRTAEMPVPASPSAVLFESDEFTPIPGLDELRQSVEMEAPILRREAAPEEETSPLTELIVRLLKLWQGDALWILLSVGAAAIGPALVTVGWDYYGLEKVDRIHHPLHEALKPSGQMGLWLGIAGSTLFLLNLSYVLRRRLGFLRSWISLRTWLNVHFLCGLAGGSLILAHSALLANNMVARISSAAIGVAVFSGIFGRYVISHLPRLRDERERKQEDLRISMRSQEEMVHDELRERQEHAERLGFVRRELRTRLADYPDLREMALNALEKGDKVQAQGLLFVIPLILGDLTAWWRGRRLAGKLRALARRQGDAELRKVMEETLRLVAAQRKIERRLGQAEAVQDLMDSWRLLHLLMAVIVLATMFLHVVINMTYNSRQLF